MRGGVYDTQFSRRGGGGGRGGGGETIDAILAHGSKDAVLVGELTAYLRSREHPAAAIAITSDTEGGRAVGEGGRGARGGG